MRLRSNTPEERFDAPLGMFQRDQGLQLRIAADAATGGRDVAVCIFILWISVGLCWVCRCRDDDGKSTQNKVSKKHGLGWLGFFSITVIGSLRSGEL